MCLVSGPAEALNSMHRTCGSARGLYEWHSEAVACHLGCSVVDDGGILFAGGDSGAQSPSIRAALAGRHSCDACLLQVSAAIVVQR